MYEKRLAYITPNAVIATDDNGFPLGPRSQIALANRSNTIATTSVSERL